MSGLRDPKRRVKLGNLSERIRVDAITITRTTTGGPGRSTSSYWLYAEVDYDSRRQEEQTVGGRELSRQQVRFKVRDQESLRTVIKKDSLVFFPKTNETYDIINIDRGIGRVGQYMWLICEIRD